MSKNKRLANERRAVDEIKLESEVKLKLEQLRFLENDEKVKCVIMEKKQQAFWELNNPEDKIIIEMILEKIDGK